MNDISVAFLSRSFQKFLEEKFPVTIVPKERFMEAEYVIGDLFDDSLLRFKGVKILYTGENHAADLNTFDYCLTHEYREDDRCHRLPYWHTYLLHREREELRRYLLGERPMVTPDELAEKQTEFCSFVCRNAKGKERNSLVRNLNKIRKVNCAGPFMNNVGGILPPGFEAKREYQRKHCFSMAYENECGPGYQTEKIVDAFISGSIPIYWGNVDVAKEFNPETFVHARDFRNQKELINYLLDLADDPVRRANMINGRILQDELVFEKCERELEDFFARIFERGPGAIQRTRHQRIMGELQKYYGHGLFRTIRFVSRKIRGKKPNN